MSNQTVGAVYQQIIRDVVDSSRVDFEEGGVDESVLDELSRVSCFHLLLYLLFPIATHFLRHHFHRIKYPLACDAKIQVDEPVDRRRGRVALSWLLFLPCGRWPLHRRGIQNQRGPSGIWSLLCSQGDAVSLGLARFWAASLT